MQHVTILMAHSRVLVMQAILVIELFALMLMNVLMKATTVTRAQPAQTCQAPSIVLVTLAIRVMESLAMMMMSVQAILMTATLKLRNLIMLNLSTVHAIPVTVEMASLVTTTMNA